jgi:hypothetical protein
VGKAIAAWGNKYLALSGLGEKLTGFSAASKHLDGRLSAYLKVSQLPVDGALGSYSGQEVPFEEVCAGTALAGIDRG